MNFKLDKLNINKRLLVLVGISVVSAAALELALVFTSCRSLQTRA